MTNTEHGKDNRGFVGKLADPEVRAERARKAALASAASRRKYAQERRVREMTQEERFSLLLDIVAVESLETLKAAQSVISLRLESLNEN